MLKTVLCELARFALHTVSGQTDLKLGNLVFIARPKKGGFMQEHPATIHARAGGPSRALQISIAAGLFSTFVQGRDR
jgi:hypothetical protein